MHGSQYEPEICGGQDKGWRPRRAHAVPCGGGAGGTAVTQQLCIALQRHVQLCISVGGIVRFVRIVRFVMPGLARRRGGAPEEQGWRPRGCRRLNTQDTTPGQHTQVSPHRPAHHTHPLPFSWLKAWLACVPDPFPASPWTGRARSLRWRMMRVLLWRGAVVLKAQASDRWRHLRRRRPKPRRSSAPQPCAVSIACLAPMLLRLLYHRSLWRNTC